ncbi:MAG: FAD-dependent oxidoreductase [Solirubrobacteraceae bacterium]|nr:FAD-dependent oxidoreductase [Solirubrobacteraceae bacterium]
MPDVETYDLLVVGGGPAGLAAAADAAALGLSVALADERATLGGQIFKQMGPGFEVRDPSALGHDYARGRALIEAAERSAATILTRTAVVAVEGDRVVLVTEGEHARTVVARRLLLAPGAHDRPVAFPGWTLPGVLTAGAAQTLVKAQRVAPGERAVFAGSGPLALAFPAQLQAMGVPVACVLEAGPPPRLGDVARMLVAARGNTRLLRDAVHYRTTLLRHRVPLRYRRIVVRAEGDGRVEQVTHARVDADWRVIPGTEETIAADTLCVGYGFTPSVELLRLVGCQMDFDEDRGGPVAVLDDWQRTSVAGVLAAGDGTGVDGSYVAIDEGRLAALGAARDLGRIDPAAADRAAAPIRARIARKRRFARALKRMHRIGPGLFELTTPDTVLCRCEEVTRARIDEAVEGTADLSAVKALTRAGMGLCQGRNCQRHVMARITARHGVQPGAIVPATPRLPARPVPLSAVAERPDEELGLFQ